MKKYNENSKEVLKAKEIGDKQFTTMCNEEEDSSDIYFMHYDVTICNPFMDDSGRFELTLDQAYEEYGVENVNKFIEDCNKN